MAAEPHSVQADVNQVEIIKAKVAQLPFVKKLILSWQIFLNEDLFLELPDYDQWLWIQSNSKIGAGESGIVCKAYFVNQEGVVDKQHPLAVKLPQLRPLSPDKKLILKEMFKQEVLLSHHLYSSRYVEIESKDKKDDNYFILMPFFKGSSLLDDKRGRDIPHPDLMFLSFTQRIGLIFSVLQKFMECHHPRFLDGEVSHERVHGDVKPGNLLIYIYRDESGKVQFDCNLIDFGFSCDLRGEVSWVESDYSCGTPVTMAPEAFGLVKDSNSKTYIQATASDLYSLAFAIAVILGEVDPFHDKERSRDKDCSGIKLYVKNMDDYLKSHDPLPQPGLRQKIFNLLDQMQELDFKKRPSVSEMMEEWMRIYRLSKTIDLFLRSDKSVDAKRVLKEIHEFNIYNDSKQDLQENTAEIAEAVTNLKNSVDEIVLRDIKALSPKQQEQRLAVQLNGHNLHQFRSSQNEKIPQDTRFQPMQRYLDQIFFKPPKLAGSASTKPLTSQSLSF